MTILWRRTLSAVGLLSPYHSTRSPFILRRLCSSEDAYIDRWFASVVKSVEFYERHSCRDQPRCYFYSIDLQGRLFMEDTLPKNVATSIKDAKFLDFFVKRLTRVDARLKETLHEYDIPTEDYPYVSPCGLELNLVRPADLPIVFHGLVDGSLIYGGTLEQSFDPSMLAVSLKSGRLYHKLSSGNPGCKASNYGLIKSSVAVTLSDRIQPMEDGSLAYENRERRIRIRELSDEDSPGAWGLPTVGI